ncbi:AbrB/MazE/SpoVT family DNA-binding domain-containing protein [Sandaracinobacteroides saxicola]|uniref:AbrB/MazE/SpoVT family DNA-binding domain-containing protein n=1 Tax=Sandaracinobacteroides saxicola TaxID=2759707 RepID=A0A7G5IIX8_9SPHN|nr:AbrB/MazE/SpoVT family DNA-binding domain-containing protein [Sandaracinobacteroides saxicola]QMW23320.1 AbrB/MazE/SpoVT family DNA-binding domain-containing protein [Sandaracinobacteroides saxicola]
MNAINAKVFHGGRMLIPAEVRRELGIEVGDQLELRVEGKVLRVMTRQAAIEEGVRRAQAILKADPAYDPGRSLVDELLADRRAEVAKEEADTHAYRLRQGLA